MAALAALGGQPRLARGDTPVTSSVQPAAAAQADVPGLGELLDMPVSVASKRDERISTAPASITAYSDEDIKALGYYTLYDLANITAGYSGSVMYGERILETRGQKAGSFNNNKHLIYVDGIPVNHARNYKGPVDGELPLFFARRVELLRGPASALYGTSAFFGVVNVVPQELTGKGMAIETRFSLGSRDGEWRVGGNALYADADRSARLTFGYYDKSASRAFVGVTDDPHNLYWDDQRSVFLNATYGLRSTPLAGLTLGFIYLGKDGGMGESWNEDGASHEINDLAWQTIIPYAKYSRSLTPNLTVSGHAMSNTGREGGAFAPLTAEQLKGGYAGTGNALDVYDTQVDAVEAQAELRWDLGAATDLIGGVSVDTRRQRGGDRSYGYMVSADPGPPYQLESTLASASDRYTIYSAYFQLRQELPLLRGLILTLGAREDLGVSPLQRFAELSPRLGVVQRLTDALIVKTFFGTALRAPGIKEVGLNQEARDNFAMLGQPPPDLPDLRAETIRSFELGTSYIGPHFSASVTVFSNRTIDALDGVQYQNLNTFRNSDGETNARGMEAEVQVAPSRHLRFLANHSWARARDPGDHDVEDVPVQHASLATIYRLPAAPLTLAAVARWAQGYRVAGGKDARTNVVMGDINVVWSIARSFDFELALHNVLDQKAKLPKHGVPDVPLPRFHVVGTLVCGF